LGLSRNATAAEVLKYIETKPVAILLFVDQTKFNVDYSNFPWVKSEAVIVDIDSEILDTLQIGKVPQFRFFVRGNEVASLVGTVSYEEYSELKTKVLGKTRSY
jgi:thiol-disulfide isomerase/thioredoxin